MLERSSSGSRTICAFAATAAALAAAGWLVISAASTYLADEAQIDVRLERELGVTELSSTTPDEARDNAPAAMTKNVRELLAKARSDRLSTRRSRNALWLRCAVFGGLALLLVAIATAAWQRERRERARLSARLVTECIHDPLTGLPNRRFFTEWLSFAITNARREREHVGVLFIDIAGCAAVAGLHGGPAAETLLVEIARRFRAAARGGDVFARLGASEFALATPNAGDTRELATLAQRLRDVLNDPAQPPLADTPIGTSIGIAFFPEDAEDSAGVMAAANAAMFAARRAGRNHVAFNALAA